MHKRIFRAILLIVLIGHATASAQITPPFNPKTIARSEVKMWKAYYEKDYSTLGYALVLLLRDQFNLSMFDAFKIGGYGAYAAYQFSQITHRRGAHRRYQQDVLPPLVVAYENLKMVLEASWDPRELAQAELDWWIEGREYGPKPVTRVGRKIARLYSLLYGKHNAHIRRAGFLRAKASYMRRRMDRRGQVDWVRVEKLLVQSYEVLAVGVVEPSPSSPSLRGGTHTLQSMPAIHNMTEQFCGAFGIV